MKLLGGSRKRRWGIIAALATAVFAAWFWVDHWPAVEEKAELEARVEALRAKEGALRKNLSKLQGELASGGVALQDVARIQRMLVDAGSLEEAGSKMQQRLQDFFEKNGVKLQSYSVLAPSSWNGIPMAQTEFRLNLGAEGLAAVLRFLEEEEKLIRVERMSIVYRGGQEMPLFVTLRVGTLFVDVENLKKYVGTGG